ncbi:MAG: 3'-5' exonuclease [Bacteroidetes bacterium]|nr:3'-5' exonuclease [Bacteroidota bacterium]
MNLQLNKNLVVLDIESTGVNFIKDKIVELFLLKIKPNGDKEEFLQRFNPQVIMTPDVIAVHGITNEMVANEPIFEEKAKAIMNFIGDADLAGFNSDKFDIPMLMEELGRAGIDLEIEKRKTIDVQRIFHKMEPRNLSAAYKFYCNKDLEGAHSASADTIATWEILDAQIGRYSELSKTVAGLHAFTSNGETLDLSGRIVYNNSKVPVFNFGKYKGFAVKEVFQKEPTYFDWIMNSDFSMQTKKVITRLRLEMMSDTTAK